MEMGKWEQRVDPRNDSSAYSVSAAGMIWNRLCENILKSMINQKGKKHLEPMFWGKKDLIQGNKYLHSAAYLWNAVLGPRLTGDKYD